MENKNRKILLVDDEEIIRIGIKFNLAKKGFEVDTAASGEEALEKLGSDFRYDLVITDLMMGEKSGVDVLRHVRKTNANFPVLIMTGYVDSALLNEARKFVAVDYISKPCSNQELYQKIQQCLGLKSEPRDEH